MSGVVGEERREEGRCITYRRVGKEREEKQNNRKMKKRQNRLKILIINEEREAADRNSVK